MPISRHFFSRFLFQYEILLQYTPWKNTELYPFNQLQLRFEVELLIEWVIVWVSLLLVVLTLCEVTLSEWVSEWVSIITASCRDAEWSDAAADVCRNSSASSSTSMRVCTVSLISSVQLASSSRKERSSESLLETATSWTDTYFWWYENLLSTHKIR